MTDINDKRIKRANDNGEAVDAFTGHFIAAMHEVADAVDVLQPDNEPRATRHFGEIIEMTTTLVEPA